MNTPSYKPTINIDEVDGNAFAVLATVQKALKKAGADEEHVRHYLEDAKDGDYDHLLQTSMKYINFE